MAAKLSDLAGHAGSRRLLESLWCQRVAQQLKRHPAISIHLPKDAVAVQCTLFDKGTDRNWLVGWHQDLAIPVREKVLDATCSGWSLKEGMTFVQPPDAVLADVIAVRVHLDDSAAGNGPLRIVPGSHRSGRLKASDALSQRALAEEVVCTASRGDALLMRPLLLHASSKADVDTPRRVLHFLFGPSELPHGLQWHLAVP